MSNATFFAAAIADAVARVTASGYTLALTFLFAVAKPPRFAQASDAAGVARNVMNARIAGVSLKATIESPLITTLPDEPLIDGNGNSPKSVPAFALRCATPGTKSPSITIAAFGGLCP